MQDQADAGTEFRGVIRKVRAPELELVGQHLMRLDSDARHRRFGHDVADSYIEGYAKSVVDPGNLAFGFFLDGRLRALAELKRPGPVWAAVAEAAFSVERTFANNGLATLLMGHVIRSARNRGVKHLLLYCLADNAKMQAIARRYCADLRFDDGAIVADIVPQDPNYSSVMQEFVEDRLGFVHSLLDYQSRLMQTN
ncbi:MAG: GNAT family N-acetyltransferase [Hyphomicrobium sp.]